MQDQTALAALGALALLTIVLLGVVVAQGRGRAAVARDLAAARTEAADLRARIDEIERRTAPPGVGVAQESAEYVITHVGEGDPVEPQPIDRALFADLVLRESVVKAAGVAHGLRRALSPEVRNRIRFEFRREVRRARKQRRADTREAVREWEAHQRAAMGDGEDAA